MENSESEESASAEISTHPPPNEATVEPIKKVAILPEVAVINTYPGGGPTHNVNSLENKNAMSSLVRLSEALGNREEIVFQSTRRIGFDATAVTVQVCGTEDVPTNLIMSTSIDPGVTIRHNSVRPNDVHTFRTGAITKFQNKEGINLMTCRETGRAQNVASGERVFGLIDGVGLYSSQLKARNPKGDILFETVEKNGIYSFMSNEVELARAGRGVTNTPGTFGVKFHNSPEMAIKAMLFATAYFIYYLHVADTIFGLRGSKGVALARCWIVLVTVIVLLAIFVAVVATIIHS